MTRLPEIDDTNKALMRFIWNGATTYDMPLVEMLGKLWVRADKDNAHFFRLVLYEFSALVVKRHEQTASVEEHRLLVGLEDWFVRELSGE